jgi:hypothetical protein
VLALSPAGARPDATPAQIQHAATLGLADTANLLVAGLSQVAARQAGVAPHSEDDEALAQCVAAALFAARQDVVALAAPLAPDLRHATLAIIEEIGRSQGMAASIAPAVGASDVPEDVEAQARGLILAGHAPPTAWRPFITKLGFSRSDIANTTPLANLTVLQTLNLDGRHASHRPVATAGLTGLQTLDLTGTDVTAWAAPRLGIALVTFMAAGGLSRPGKNRSWCSMINAAWQFERQAPSIGSHSQRVCHVPATTLPPGYPRDPAADAAAGAREETRKSQPAEVLLVGDLQPQGRHSSAPD